MSNLSRLYEEWQAEVRKEGRAFASLMMAADPQDEQATAAWEEAADRCKAARDAWFSAQREA